MSIRGQNAKINSGSSSIPSGSKKIVQSLKEIVNCPDQEIYATLKECNMDPNEAISKLLSQDIFHEVKSKREKKKENRDTGEFRSCGIGHISNRGYRGDMNRYVGHGGSKQFRSCGVSGSGVSFVKPSFKKDNGPNYYSSSLSTAAVSGNHLNVHPVFTRSNHVPTENKISTIVGGDCITSSSQLLSGIQATWLEVPGQKSMADIVKMGLSSPNLSHESLISRQIFVPTSTALQCDLLPSQNYASKESQINSEPRKDEWPLLEQPAVGNVPSITPAAGISDLHTDSSILPTDGSHQHIESYEDQDWVGEDVENRNSNYVGSPLPSLNIPDENSRDTSHFNDEFYENMNSYESQSHTFDGKEDVCVTVSSGIDNFQDLSLQEDQLDDFKEDTKSVKIPNHLQVQAEQFSHLSFGSFGVGVNVISEPFGFGSLTNEEDSSAVDDLPVGISDIRKSEFYGDEQCKTMSDSNVTHRNGVIAGTHDSQSVLVPEASKQEDLQDAQSNQYRLPPSAPDYNFENTPHSSSSFSHPQPSSQLLDHAPFPTAYSDSLSSSLLAPTVQPVRESDIAYSPYFMTEPVPPKYNTMSSISEPTISITEVLRSGNFGSPQPTGQTMPVNSVVAGHAIPQHHLTSVHHPYSQPTFPLGHFTNMIGYHHFLPQSYAYLPSAYQQYHQSLGATLPPQYKNSLPHSSAAPSDYGAFGNSTSISGNYLHNPSTAPTGTTLGYDSIMTSQYNKDVNPLISNQQVRNENPGMWLHEVESRKMSSVPASTYYSTYQNQAGGFRQGQQQQQHIGYPNYYHSRPEMSMDVGSQVQQFKQSGQQTWRNNY